MEEQQSMTTVKALAILDIKSAKFHSLKDQPFGLNKVSFITYRGLKIEK